MKKLIYIFAILAFTLTSCDKNVADINNNVINENNTGLLIKKVRKLENPYSVSNMKKAYASLQNEGLMKAPLNIEATHLYVRFLPKDSADLETLMKDTTLVLFSYPLDYQLTEGEKYIDSTLIGNDFTWLYTKVSVGYVSPISGFEVLEELYLPMEVANNLQQTKQQRVSLTLNDSWSIIEERSLRLTGNYETTTTPTGMQKAKWWPTATIRVKDDLTGTFIPVEGVIVRARWWFNWETGITKSNGVADMTGSFSGKLNWSMVWEGSNWDIRDGLFLQAYFNGPDGTKSNWDLNIDSGKSKAYAHVHRACWTMYHGDNMGSCKQFYQLSPETRQKISVYDKDGGDKSGINYGANWFVFSQIGIYMKSTGVGNPYYQSYNIFGTTIHELTHGFHILDMDVDLASFIFIKGIIQESWPSTLEWAITINEYKRLGLSIDYNNRQLWALLKTDYSKNLKSMDYSPIFIDLIDNYNQRNTYNQTTYPDYEFPDDNVTGFTIAELRSILRKSFSVSDLKKNVKALRTDSTILSNIDKLFETYEKAK